MKGVFFVLSSLVSCIVRIATLFESAISVSSAILFVRLLVLHCRMFSLVRFLCEVGFWGVARGGC